MSRLVVQFAVIFLCSSTLAQDPRLQDLQSLSVKDLSDTTFECGWRSVAYDFGLHLLPRYSSFPLLFDALGMHTLCNQTLRDDLHHPDPTHINIDPLLPRMDDTGVLNIYVDPLNGRDG